MGMSGEYTLCSLAINLPLFTAMHAVSVYGQTNEVNAHEGTSI